MNNRSHWCWTRDVNYVSQSFLVEVSRGSGLIQTHVCQHVSTVVRTKLDFICQVFTVGSDTVALHHHVCLYSSFHFLFLFSRPLSLFSTFISFLQTSLSLSVSFQPLSVGRSVPTVPGSVGSVPVCVFWGVVGGVSGQETRGQSRGEGSEWVEDLVPAGSWSKNKQPQTCLDISVIIISFIRNVLMMLLKGEVHCFSMFY